MTNILRFSDFSDSDIRVTEDGRFSVFDVMRHCTGNEDIGVIHRAWKQLCIDFPSLSLAPQYTFGKSHEASTPVLGFEEMVHFVRQIRKSPKEMDSIFMTKTPCATEFTFRDALRDFYIECEENVTTEYKCEVGIADIVTDTTVVEVKAIQNWKSAIGQAVVYASCLNKFPEVAFYGCSKNDNFDKVLAYCTKLNVACSIWDTSNGDAFAFLYGQGSWTVTNQDVLAKKRLTKLSKKRN
jgi:hypothetical protein